MNDIQKTAIAHLESLLSLAKDGKIVSYFIVAKKEDGLAEVKYGQNQVGYFDLIGFIECGKAKLLEETLRSECRRSV